jgi:hypothetical protein
VKIFGASPCSIHDARWELFVTLAKESSRPAESIKGDSLIVGRVLAERSVLLKKPACMGIESLQGCGLVP